MSELAEDDEQQREQQLLKIINSTGIVCHVCKLSEEVLRSDILIDQSECKKHLCVACFEKIGEQHCQVDHTHQDHFLRRGVKFTHKVGLEDQANRYYIRQQKIRNNPEYNELDLDLVHTMSYLYNNPAPPQQRVSYVSLENSVKQSLAEKNRSKRKIINKDNRRGKATFISRQDRRNTETGIETCGYDQTYYKGFTLIQRAYEKAANKQKQKEENP